MARSRLSRGAGIGSIADCPLDPKFDDDRVRHLEQAFGIRAHQVLLTANPASLVARYRDRLQSLERHAGHGGPEVLRVIAARVAVPPQPLAVAGRTLRVDTTDFGKVSYAAIAEQLRRTIDAGA